MRRAEGPVVFISASGRGHVRDPRVQRPEQEQQARCGHRISLPGIGDQKAREIVAKLQGKVGKFGLIQDKFSHDAPAEKEDIMEEALSVLMQLQYKPAEAKEMIAKAVKFNPKISSCEEILNEVYKRAKVGAHG